MNQPPERPMHQPETCFTGELQVFEGTALDPNDPSLEPRERKGRPADRIRHPDVDKDAPPASDSATANDDS